MVPVGLRERNKQKMRTAISDTATQLFIKQGFDNVTVAEIAEAAGVSTSGLRGQLRVRGLIAVWMWTLRAWERDERADLSGTMAALDAALRRADRLAALLGGGSTPAEASGAPAEPSDTLAEPSGTTEADASAAEPDAEPTAPAPDTPPA